MTTEFDANLQLLSWTGLASPDQKKISNWRFGYSVVVTTPYIVMGLLAITYFFTVPFSLINTTIYGYILVNLLLTIFRVAIFYSSKEKIEKIVKTLSEDFHSDNDLSKEVKTMRATSNWKIIKLTAFMVAYNVISVLITAIIPALNRVSRALECKEVDCAREVNYEIWWPSDIHTKPTYYILTLWQMLAAVIFTAISCACDSFVCSLLVAITERAIFLTKTASMAFLAGSRGQITPIFRAWIQYHQNYLQAVREINSVLGSLIFLTHGFTGVSIIAFCYFFMSYTNNPINLVTITTMAGFLVQIYIYSFCGQNLIDSSGNLALSVVSSAAISRGCLRGSGGARSCLQIAVTRMSAGAPPEQIVPLGFFISSMELFVRLITTSLLYILILVQLQ